MSKVILNVVDDDSDFVRVVGVGAHGAHRLLNVERQRLSGAGKNDGLTARDVKTLTEKLGVAQNFELAFAKIFYNGGASLFGCLSVTMSGGNAGAGKSVGDGNGMSDVDAIANGGFVGSKFLIVVDDAADNFFVVHDAFEVVIIEFAEFDTDVMKVNADGGGKIIKSGQVAEVNELVDGKGLNHGRKNVAKGNAAHALRGGGDTEQIGVREGVKDFLVGVGEDMMALVANEKIGLGQAVNAAGKCLNAGDLNRDFGLHFETGRNDAERNVESGKSLSGLFDELVSVNEKNRAFVASERFLNHPAGHNGFARAAGGDADDAFVIVSKFVADGVNEVALIRAEFDVGQDLFLLSFCNLS